MLVSTEKSAVFSRQSRLFQLKKTDNSRLFFRSNRACFEPGKLRTIRGVFRRLLREYYATFGLEIRLSTKIRLFCVISSHNIVQSMHLVYILFICLCFLFYFTTWLMYILYWLYAFKLEDKYYSFALTKLVVNARPRFVKVRPFRQWKRDSRVLTRDKRTGLYNYYTSGGAII